MTDHRASAALAWIAAALVPCAAAYAQDPEPERDPEEDRLELEAIDSADRIFRARAYSALIQEEDIHRQFRDYLASNEKGLRDSRGMLTDKLQVSGGLTASELFDNNIFLTSRNERADFVTIFSPSIRARFRDTHLRAQAEYVGRQRFYSRNSEFSGMEHLLSADVAYATPVAGVRLEQRFIRAEDPVDTLVLKDHVDRRNIETTAGVTIGSNHIHVDLAAARATVDILDDNVPGYFSFERRQADAQLGVDVVVRTTLYLDLGANETTYDGDVLDDFDTRWVALGWKGHASEKLQFDAKLGWIRVDVVESSGSIDREDAQGVLARASVTWRLWESTLLTMVLRHEPVATASTGNLTRTRLDLGWQQWIAERFTGRLAGYVELGAVTGDGEDTLYYGLIAGVRYEIGRNYFADVTAETRAARALDGGSVYENLRASVSVGVEF